MNGNVFFLQTPLEWCARGCAVCVWCVYVHSLLMRGASFRSVPSQECAEFKQQPHSAPSQPPLSSQQLGAIFLLLCVSCYGKRTRSPPERNRQTITLSGKAAQTQWADCKSGLEEGKKGPNERGRTHTERGCFLNGIDEQSRLENYIFHDAESL